MIYRPMNDIHRSLGTADRTFEYHPAKSAAHCRSSALMGSFRSLGTRRSRWAPATPRACIHMSVGLAIVCVSTSFCLLCFPTRICIRKAPPQPPTPWCILPCNTCKQSAGTNLSCLDRSPDKVLNHMYVGVMHSAFEEDKT